MTQIQIATCRQQPLVGAPGHEVDGTYVDLGGHPAYKIGNVDRMPTFFMSLVSASDLWMFVASNGGLTAGRVDADSALFPYATHDKIMETAATHGPATLLRVHRGEAPRLWEPFRDLGRRLYRVERNLYKNDLGNRLTFEAINHDLELAFRYTWRFSDLYGVVRTAELANLDDEPVRVDVLDGLQDLLPYGATTALQATMSNLLDAYKRSELETESGLGIFALSSTLTDLAEPSESLRATTVWQVGLEATAHLISSQQLERFRQGLALRTEADLRGRRGAYFVEASVTLEPGTPQRWNLVADVGRDHAEVIALRNALRDDPAGLTKRLEQDVRDGDAALAAIIARADGQEWTADRPATTRHVASVLFNVMRGGTFPGDDVVRDDLVDFVEVRNPAALREHAAFFDALPARFPYRSLVAAAENVGAPELERLCRGYLPLAFSRRHGDPSRPWNRFAIRIRHPDGRPRLDYQGNWRDIFQNWEALAWAFPDYVEGMIAIFLSATTADGYNPYRITRDGIEWEEPEPDNPWANIGYWSDHQIIYLQKLLEVSDAFHPGALDGLLGKRIFSHADVPYRIKPYDDVLEDPYATIRFDRERDRAIQAAVAEHGTDARLLRGPDGSTLHASMADKLLLLLLVKLANLVPEGGIWMNTQRPEWNDGNNALVGKGLSVVTVSYLVRYVRFVRALFGRAGTDPELAVELERFLRTVDGVLAEHDDALSGSLGDASRRTVMDGLGRAGSDYRTKLYDAGLSGRTTTVDAASVDAFLARAQAWLEHTLAANRRDDGLFHSYNLLEVDAGVAHVDTLYEMLEGQVAALSSGLLSSEASLELLRALRASRLFRPDQHSYILYPDRDLPGFLQKNRIPADAAAGSELIHALLERGDTRLVVPDEDGALHFQADFKNARGVRRVLAELAEDEGLAELVDAEGERLAELFEDVFDHASFTGRSGTFFAYEGLGSIYWHMVSKLLLAVQETWRRAADAGEDAATLAELEAAYYDVRAGLGFNKTPDVYGAFPTDPYSHTPAHAGAQQPGMTGQVKEDVLTRIGEVGVVVRDGRLGFAPGLLRRAEFFADGAHVAARVADGTRELELAADGLAFTQCQVPVVYRLGDGPAEIRVTRSDGRVETVSGAELDPETSAEIFRRDGTVARLDVRLPRSSISATPA